VDYVGSAGRLVPCYCLHWFHTRTVDLPVSYWTLLWVFCISTRWTVRFHRYAHRTALRALRTHACFITLLLFCPATSVHLPTTHGAYLPTLRFCWFACYTCAGFVAGFVVCGLPFAVPARVSAARRAPCCSRYAFTTLHTTFCYAPAAACAFCWTFVSGRTVIRVGTFCCLWCLVVVTLCSTACWFTAFMVGSVPAAFRFLYLSLRYTPYHLFLPFAAFVPALRYATLSPCRCAHCTSFRLHARLRARLLLCRYAAGWDPAVWLYVATTTAAHCRTTRLHQLDYAAGSCRYYTAAFVLFYVLFVLLPHWFTCSGSLPSRSAVLFVYRCGSLPRSPAVLGSSFHTTLFTALRCRAHCCTVVVYRYVRTATAGSLFV